MPLPHVHVFLGAAQLPPSVHAALARVQASASFTTLDAPARMLPAADAFVVVPPTGAANHPRISTLLSSISAQPQATLVIRQHADERPLPCPPSQPLCYADADSAEQVAGRLAAMLELQHALQTIRRTARPTHKGDPRVSPARSAGDPLAQRMILNTARLAVSVIARPQEEISGDLVDHAWLDDHTLAVALMDATGHGPPAALLSLLVREARRASPSDVRRAPALQLARLNAAVLESEVVDTPLAALLYAVIDTRTREVLLARGGAPYPILAQRGRAARLLTPGGPLIGLEPDSEFDQAAIALRPGESLLLHTDGVDRVLQESAAQQPPAPRATEQAGLWSQIRRSSWLRRAASQAGDLPPDQAIRATRWFATLQVDVPRALSALVRRYDVSQAAGCSLDDLTVVHVRCG